MPDVEIERHEAKIDVWQEMLDSIDELRLEAVNITRCTENRLFTHLDGVCKKFMGIPLHYLGYIAKDDIVPISISKQRIAVMSVPHSPIVRNFLQIAKIVASW